MTIWMAIAAVVLIVYLLFILGRRSRQNETISSEPASVRNVDGVAERAVLAVTGNKELDIDGMLPEFLNLAKDTSAKAGVAGELVVTDEMEEDVANEFVGFLAYHVAWRIKHMAGFADVEEQAILTASIVEAIGKRTNEQIVSKRFKEYWIATDLEEPLKAFSRYVGFALTREHYPITSILAGTYASRFPDVAGIVISTTPHSQT